RERLRYVPPGGARRGAPARIGLREIAQDRLVMPQGVCGLADATRAMFAGAGLTIDEYPGRAISYGTLEDWAGLGLGGGLIPPSKVRTTEPLPVVMLSDPPALVTYDAMWPRGVLANHVRAFARQLPVLARSLFSSTKGVWAPGSLASGRKSAS